MWQLKTFKTHDKMLKWIEKHGSKFEYVEVYVNNGFALDIKPLVVIDIA